MNEARIERLNFLIRVVTKEIQHLNYSSQLVFIQPFSIERVDLLASDEAFAQTVEAFVSRFSRLQDTIADKLIPVWLMLMGEKLGAAIDNLDKAEKLGVLHSADEWLEIRQLRNLMVHEYIESVEILADALNTAHRFQAILIDCAVAITHDCQARGLINRRKLEMD